MSSFKWSPLPSASGGGASQIVDTTYDPAFDGGTTPIVTLVKVGRLVTMVIGALEIETDTDVLSTSSIPAAFRPEVDTLACIPVLNDGTEAAGAIFIGSGGNISVSSSVAFSGWTTTAAWTSITVSWITAS